MTQRKSGFLRRTMVPLFVLSALVLEVEAIQDPQTQGHDYSLISTRNAFNLSNEPPPRKETAPPPEPPKNLDLKFTGIFKLRGVEKACLAVTDTTAKPPETKYFQMPVGDKQGEIEITAIDAKTGLVKILRNGAPIELSLSNDEHTYKTAVAKAPTKSSSRSSSSRTSSRSSSSSRPTSGRTSGSSFTRPSRPSSSTSSSRTSSGSRSIPSRSSNSLRAVPMRGGSTNPTPPVIQQDRDPGIQAIEMIKQKQDAENAGVPMPPLPFQNELNDAPAGGAGDGPATGGPPLPPVPGRYGPPLPPIPGQPPLPPVPPGG